MSDYEQKFIEVYGLERLKRLSVFMEAHGLIEKYQQVRASPIELCGFGFQYGLVEIVAFCYCHLKISLDIRQVVDGHFKIVNSTQPEFTELTPDGREVARLGIPTIHHFGAPDGMVIATLDEFTAGRRACLDYLLRMIRFSRYTITKDGRAFHYLYRVVDKYIDSYRLLEVC